MDGPEDLAPTAFSGVFFAMMRGPPDAVVVGPGAPGRAAPAPAPATAVGGWAAVGAGGIAARSIFLLSLATFFSVIFLAVSLSRAACVLPAVATLATAFTRASFLALTSALTATVFLAAGFAAAVFVAWLRARVEAALAAFLLCTAFFSLIFILVFADAVLEAAAFRAVVLAAACFVTDCFAARFLGPLVVRVVRALVAVSALFLAPADLDDFPDLLRALRVFPRSAAEASAF